MRKQSTLLYLVDRKSTPPRICMAMKKRGFGEGKWNGVGGKVDPTDETIDEAAIREAREEIKVVVKHLEKMAEITFHFNDQPDIGQEVHVYLAYDWGDTEPVETDEMRPVWFPIDDVPYHQMWASDCEWLPLILQGKYVTAAYTFQNSETIAHRELVIR